MFRQSKTFLVRVVILSCWVTSLAQHFDHDALAQEKIRIGISFLSPSFLPTVVAEKKGFYTKYGIASEHVLISLSVAMSALGTGDLDYACSVAQGVAAAIKGIPLKLVMITQKNLVFALVVRPEVQKVADLKGKTVGISYLGSTMHLVADTIFRHHGLVPGKDVNLFRLVIIKAGFWPSKQVELTRVLATRPLTSGLISADTKYWSGLMTTSLSRKLLYWLQTRRYSSRATKLKE